MAQILDRGEGNAKRRDRLKKIKKGDGTFVYDGSSVDTEWTPTPKLTGHKEATLDVHGMPVVDSSGRQAYKPAGRIVTDDSGRPVLGGIPKVTRHKIETRVVRGVSFPAGEPVKVGAELALKLRCMAHFEEVAGDEPEEKELADMTKADLLELAKNEGIIIPPGTTKAEILEMLDTKPAA